MVPSGIRRTWVLQEVALLGRSLEKPKTHLAVFLPLEYVGQVRCVRAYWVVVWHLSVRCSGEPSTLYLALLKSFPNSGRKPAEGCSLVDS